MFIFELFEGKKKGADGKACWDGYRYNGTKDGKDSCVKVGESEYDDDEDQEQGFFVALGSEDDGGFVGMVVKDGGKWREVQVSGNAPHNWGGSYMGYLSPDDVMTWIRKDYRHSDVAGPFSDEQDAMEYAQSQYGLDPIDEQGMAEGEVYDLEKEYGYEKAPAKRYSNPQGAIPRDPADDSYSGSRAERALKADQERVKKAWADHLAKQKEQGMNEGGFKNKTAVFSGYSNYMKSRAPNVFKHYDIKVLGKEHFEDEDIIEYTVISDGDSLAKARAHLERSDQFGGMILKQGVAESYPKHQDLSGVSTDKLKAYLAKQGQQQTSGEGNQVKRVRAELQRRQQGVAEGLNDTQKKIEDTINKLEDRLKHAKTDEQWDNIKNRIERLQAGLKRSEQGVAEGVAETLPMQDAVKVLKHYGAEHFKTTSNELHFYKNGRGLSVDLVMNPDATRSVTLSSLNSATRSLKGQGVAEGGKGISADKETKFHAKLDKLVHNTFGKRESEKGMAEGYNEPSSRDAVMSSIIRRITMQHLDALGKYGPQAIMDAAEETADWVGDVDEIGSSDVSIWTRQTLERLGHK